MSIAENMLLGMVKSLGISPDDVKQVAGMVARLNVMVAEIDGFKSGTVEMVRHFNSRLDRIEAKLDRIAGTNSLPALDSPMPNGKGLHNG